MHTTNPLIYINTRICREDHITAATDDDTVESLKGLTIEPEPTSKSSSTVVTVKLNDGADEKSIKLDVRFSYSLNLESIYNFD